MKIVSIFAGKLFSFHYDNVPNNEYDRLMDLWTDPEYLTHFAKANAIQNLNDFRNEILYDAEYIQDIMDEINNGKQLESFFQPLNDLEIGVKILSLQKGKLRKSHLRLYAIKIDENLFVITGGAIKITHKMNEHIDTQNELIKISKAKQYLKEEGLTDSEGFYEFLND